MSENEEWRPVVGFEGLYEVSDHGRVRNDTQRALAERYGVARTTIQAIKNRRTWAHLEDA